MAKLINICQRNSNKIDSIISEVGDQKRQIGEILARLEESKTEVTVKGKENREKQQEFYKVNKINVHCLLFLFAKSFFLFTTDWLQNAIKELLNELFSEHKQLKDEELKERLTTKLQNDVRRFQHLQKFAEKRITFDMLWDDKMYSAVSIQVMFD